MIYISCEFTVPIGHYSDDDHLRCLKLEIYSYDQVSNKVTLGRIGADQLMISDALNEGRILFDICDQDSQGLYEAYVALFDGAGEFQQELEIEDPADHLIFVWMTIFHPRIHPYRQAIIDKVGTKFGYQSVLAMWHNTSELTVGELAQLGFRKIAQNALIYRHSAWNNQFGTEHPRGIDVPLDFEPTLEDEEWVTKEVEEADLDGP